jgi:hypothetical protein
MKNHISNNQTLSTVSYVAALCPTPSGKWGNYAIGGTLGTTGNKIHHSANAEYLLLLILYPTFKGITI